MILSCREGKMPIGSELGTCREYGLNARFWIKGNLEIIFESCCQKKGKKVFFVQTNYLNHIIFDAKGDP